MDLPTAQLGSAPSIQMGGYVPAAAYRPGRRRRLHLDQGERRSRRD